MKQYNASQMVTQASNSVDILAQHIMLAAFRCVDFRKFYLPYGAKNGEEEEIRPSIALRLDEWSDLYSLVDRINASMLTHVI